MRRAMKMPEARKKSVRVVETNSPNQLFVRVRNSARPKPTKRANMVLLRCLSKRVLE